jgi:hypothetical protein
MVRSIRRILKRISSSIIKKRIKSGKIVYFESLLEELALNIFQINLILSRKYYTASLNRMSESTDSGSVFLLYMKAC